MTRGNDQLKYIGLISWDPGRPVKVLQSQGQRWLAARVAGEGEA